MTWRGTEDIADDLRLNEAERADKNIQAQLKDIHSAEFALNTLPADSNQYWDASYAWKAIHALRDWKRMSEYYIELARRRIKQQQDAEAIELMARKIT